MKNQMPTIRENENESIVKILRSFKEGINLFDLYFEYLISLSSNSNKLWNKSLQELYTNMSEAFNEQFDLIENLEQ